MWVANWTVSNPDVTSSDPCNPDDSGLPGATIWQCTGDTNIPYLNSVDVDSSTLINPGSL